MNNFDEKKYTRLFQISALWNIAIAGGWMILFGFINKLVFGFDTVISHGPATFALRTCVALIFVYGIGYYFVSRDLSENRGIVWMGILGKIAVFVCALIYLISGVITFFCMLLATGDLIFAGLFINFILDQDKANSR